MVMDLGRISYKRKATFFVDDNRPVTISWYRAPPGAKVFPTQHKWGSLFWYSEPWNAEGVGENFATAHTWSRGDTPAGVTGQSYFGPLKYFQDGCPFDPLSVTPRLDSGIAVECVGCDRDWIADETGECSFILQEDGSGIELEV